MSYLRLKAMFYNSYVSDCASVYDTVLPKFLISVEILSNSFLPRVFSLTYLSADNVTFSLYRLIVFLVKIC